MAKRNIRMKEFEANIEKIHIPTDEYLKKSPSLNKEQAYFQRTDENGFIQSNLFFNEDFKVVIIGDSFVENIFVDESKRIHSIIETRFLNIGKKVKVYNAGVSGATGLGMLNTILNKIVYLKPDLIIYVQPCCDFSALLYKQGYFNDSKFFSNLVPSSEKDTPYFETIENNAKQILNNICLVSKLCEINDIKLSIATCCSISSKRQLKIMNDIIRNNISFGYKLIDLDNIIPKSELYFYDNVHLNWKGSDFLGDILFNHINDNFSIKHSKVEHKKQLIKFENVVFNKLNNSEIIEIKNNSRLSISFKFNNINKDKKGHLFINLKVLYFINGAINHTEIHKIKHPIGYELESSIALHATKTKYDALQIELSVDNHDTPINIDYFYLHHIYENQGDML
ncbi:SGNH/GDSL hydrolase family protein [Neisseria zalophi]|uniref:SGNH/GDSL hydrolase family protein n=1 Tax=Neisseria zalophi TaxID=640030 RepID=A0A5J6PTL0_9NEIS|nr:SGNH/GDSL hydrolase family protein [Neisseria zalophi]QEY25644.1 SGNH/GDSL hydrolase family protein [Neisseria zalophi]